MPWTNRGAKNVLDVTFRGATPPTQFNLMYFRATNTPTRATNLVSELVEITAGNGYTTGGIAVARNSTDFDVLTEDDTSHFARLEMKNLEITASGGTIPSSGLGAFWAALVDNNVTIANREVWFYFSLGAATIVNDGFKLTLIDTAIRILPQP